MLIDKNISRNKVKFSYANRKVINNLKVFEVF